NLGNGTYEHSWNTAGLAEGTYTITIHVTDLAGNEVQADASVLLEQATDVMNTILFVVIMALGLLIIGAIVKSTRKKPTKAKASHGPGKKKSAGKFAPAYQLADTLAAKETPSPESKRPAPVEPVARSKEGTDMKPATDGSKEPAAPATTAVKAPVATKMTTKVSANAIPAATPAPAATSKEPRTTKQDAKVMASRTEDKLAPARGTANDTTASATKPEKTEGHVDDKIDIKQVEDKMAGIFAKHDYFIPSKTDVYSEMKQLGFSMFQIELAFDNLRRADVITYNASVPRGWQFKKPAQKK
ncbi:MAG: hypothetical protein GYA24_00965, partial [Candidatus Lokiarchaeota archaeon]|nr:hypothetical protein [Candidatus Lokiarchaeota archaeon]